MEIICNSEGKIWKIKSKSDRVGTAIYQELCKQLGFDPLNKILAVQSKRYIKMYFGNLTSEYNTAVCDGREDGKKIFPDRRGNCGAKKCSRKKAKN